MYKYYRKKKLLCNNDVLRYQKIRKSKNVCRLMLHVQKVSLLESLTFLRHYIRLTCIDSAENSYLFSKFLITDIKLQILINKRLYTNKHPW